MLENPQEPRRGRQVHIDDFNELAPTGETVFDPDAFGGAIERPMQERQQRVVRFVVDRGGGDPDFQRIAVQPRNLGPPRVRLYVHRKPDPAVVGIEREPAHGRFQNNRVTATSSQATGTISSSWPATSTNTGDRSTLPTGGTSFWNGRRNGRATLFMSGATGL